LVYFWWSFELMSNSNILLGRKFSTTVTLKTNLISWWDFSGNMNDSHGSNTMGTVLNSATTSFISGLNGSAIYIDGSSFSSASVSYLNVSAPVGFSRTQPFTYGGWFKIIGTTGVQGIFNMSLNPMVTDVPVGGTSPVALSAELSDLFSPRPSVSIDLSTWMLIVIKYNPTSGSCTYYYPATGSISTGVSGSAFTSNNLSIGIARGNNAVRTGDTAIDSAFLWQRELSNAEITQLYNGGAGLTYASL
jgi:hypothetical protein